MISVWMATVAGIVGTALGGGIAFLFGRRGESTAQMLTVFAGGVMLAIAFFDLIPEALTIGGLGMAAIGVLGGVLLIGLMSLALDRVPGGGGFLLLIGIGLHNFPEGLAIGAGGAYDFRLGLVLAVLILLHDIPEGLAVAAPLLAQGMGKGKILGLMVLCGAPTALGGLVGLVMGQAGQELTALSLALAGGAMIYMTFCEVLPRALQGGRRSAAAVGVAGVLFGLITVQLLA